MKRLDATTGEVVDIDPAERDWVQPIDWSARIEARAEQAISAGVTVTLQGTDYGIRTTPSGRSLIAGGALRATRAQNAGTPITRKIPTDKGVISVSNGDLMKVFDAVDDRHQEVMDRVEQLEAKVADGTITEADLETGWNE